MKFDGIVLAQAGCTANNLQFLKAYLFNENNGEILSNAVAEGSEGKAKESFYLAFQFRLNSCA